MSQQKPTDLAGMKDKYSMALDEIKLERSISSMTHVLKNEYSERKTHYLENEIAHMERQLNSIRKQRSDK